MTIQTDDRRTGVAEIEVAEGTVVVFTDLGCPWATVALHRFYAERSRQGLDDQVRVDLRPFLLEEVNGAPTPYAILQPEIPVVGTIEPDFGFAPWGADPTTWPVTMLPANEAVYAAKAQSLAAGEELDLALRKAFFADSRCISLRHVVLDVAGTCDSVDVDQLRSDLDQGTARGALMADHHAYADEVRGSPHFFLADGSDVTNPGVDLHWQGEPGEGFPVVDSDDRSVFADLVKRAAG